MAYALKYSARAARQLLALERYLATRFYPRRAALYTDRIRARCTRLLLAPMQGQRADHLRPGLRIVGMESRVTVAYRIEGSVVRILAVAYGGQKIEPAL